MEVSRGRQSVKNVIAAIILKIFQIILPFITRTIIVHEFGLEYVGLSGLFNSIIGMLSVAELGIGTALIYAMYIPIKDNDYIKINAILNFYKKAYFTIGLIVGIIGCIIMPFLDVIIKEGTYPQEINIYILYVFYLCNTIITYLVYAYKASVLDAHQMGFLASKVKLKMLFVQYLIQIVIILIVKNYYIYSLMLPLCTLVSCLLIARISDKLYPDYKPSGELEKGEKKRIFYNVKALFLYKIGSIVLNSVDNIVISWYFGIYILGIYNNYYYIISSVFSILLTVYSAVTPSIGNAIASKNKKDNYEDYMNLSLGYSWVVGWCVTCIICLMQPFMEIWIGKEGLLPIGCVWIFGMYFFSFRVCDVVGWYKDAAGLWEKDQYYRLIAAGVNLFLNIFLIQVIGIYGVLISTIISLIFIQYPIAIKVILSYFEVEHKEYIKQLIYTSVMILFVAVISYFLCSHIAINNLIIELLVRIFICIIISNILFLVGFSKMKRFREMTKLIWSKIKNVL